MIAEPLRDYVFTPHARFEIERRGLGEELVRGVLEAPGQRWELQPGRHVLQSKISMGEPPRVYVLRVIVDVDKQPNEVVTAYRSSKIDKYWRNEP
jgi:hypothetical protein